MQQAVTCIHVPLAQLVPYLQRNFAIVTKTGRISWMLHGQICQPNMMLVTQTESGILHGCNPAPDHPLNWETIPGVYSRIFLLWKWMRACFRGCWGRLTTWICCLASPWCTPPNSFRLMKLFPEWILDTTSYKWWELWRVMHVRLKIYLNYLWVIANKKWITTVISGLNIYTSGLSWRPKSPVLWNESNSPIQSPLNRWKKSQSAHRKDEALCHNVKTAPGT